MDDRLLGFLAEHPEFFEGTMDALVLRKDLRTSFESYAQAIDPVSYEKLRARVEAYREQEKERLQDEIGQWERERKRAESHLQEVSRELQKLERELRRLEQRIQALPREVPEAAAGPAWYNSIFVFLFLDFLGVLFLYAGILLNKALDFSYILAGLICVAAGFFLAYGGPSRPAESPLPRSLEMREKLAHRKKQFREISKIKRVTLEERKKVALGKIRELNENIEANLMRINEYNI